MQSAIYVALSAQVALEKRLNTVANNVANLNTGGYRADEVKFETVLSQAGTRSVAFASMGQPYVSQKSGPVVKTDNPLDVAIQGDAWLAFDTPFGPVYTKDGRMKMSETGELQTMDGYAVLDSGGAPILLNPQAGTPSIGRDGSITQDNVEVSTLGLFTIDPRSKLSRFENSGIRSSIPASPVQDFSAAGMQQGYAEGSNVNAVMEITKLIAISRAFESAATTIQETESSFMSAIRTLGPSTS